VVKEQYLTQNQEVRLPWAEYMRNPEVCCVFLSFNALLWEQCMILADQISNRKFERWPGLVAVKLSLSGIIERQIFLLMS
jgi:hypothetical protein